MKLILILDEDGRKIERDYKVAIDENRNVLVPQNLQEILESMVNTLKSPL